MMRPKLMSFLQSIAKQIRTISMLSLLLFLTFAISCSKQPPEPPQPTKWEYLIRKYEDYRIASYSNQNIFNGSSVHHNVMLPSLPPSAELQQLGDEGWELCGTTDPCQKTGLKIIRRTP